MQKGLAIVWKVAAVNLHVNCHVNGTTFQIGLRLQTGLSSLRVSCKLVIILAVINMLLMLGLVERLKNSDPILESKMAELNQNQN